MTIGDQCADRQNNKGKDADDSTYIVVLLIYGQLVQPGNQQVGVACGRRKVGNRIASREQIDHIEVVDIASESCDQVRGGNVEHIRQSDVNESFYRAGTVYGSSLINIGGDVFEDTGELQQSVGDTYPDIDNDNSYTCL